MKKQNGFTVIEGLLILLIVVLVAGTGWYVMHAKSQANKNLDSASSDNFASVKKKVSSANPNILPKKKTTAAAPGLVSYSATLSSANDVSKLSGVSDDFKQFVSDDFDKNKSPSPCGHAFGLVIHQILSDQFATGTEKQCKNTEKLWYKDKDTNKWQEIAATDTNFTCDTINQYKVPASIVNQCLDKTNLVNNTN